MKQHDLTTRRLNVGQVWGLFGRRTGEKKTSTLETEWRLGSKTYSLLLLLLLRIKMAMQTGIAHFIYYINKTININIIRLCTVN